MSDSAVSVTIRLWAGARAAAPIGFCGDPPGITLGRLGLSRRMSAGGDQAGLTYLPSM